jgi:hypothetical protein
LLKYFHVLVLIMAVGTTPMHAMVDCSDRPHPYQGKKKRVEVFTPESLASVRVLVLDEVDRLFDMGMVSQVRC